MSLPKPPLSELLTWSWSNFEPHVRDLETTALTQDNAAEWMKRWSDLASLVGELGSRTQVAVTVNTADTEAETAYNRYLDEVQEPAAAANQRLKEKLLASGLTPTGFDLALKGMRVEAALFREENLPLGTEEAKLCTEYDKIDGAQTVHWDGEERTLAQLLPVQLEPDRDRREAAWRLAMTRKLQDREAINDLWGRFLANRLRQSRNADLGDDYRTMRWQLTRRWDYSPADCRTFHDAIEKTVVPAVARLRERRRQALGLATLRPWDLEVDPHGRAPLHPFHSAEELTAKTQAIVDQVDPVLAGYLKTMAAEGLLDLDNRRNKAPGGYCTEFPAVGRPFIFMNAVGMHDDVQTMLHEAGHAFHAFESFAAQPTNFQREVGAEFCEVASMGFELLGAPYLAGTFYSGADAARAQIDHLESMLAFWPYMAVVDAFQHWVYENPADAAKPEACDAEWDRQWNRFMVGVDYSGLDEERKTGWHRKLHIHQIPFYYVEYGLAQLGAVQVWRNSLADGPAAVRAYRHALSLGSTVGFPDLFAAAGAKFAFDAGTLGEAVTLLETQIDRLSA